MPRDGKIFSHSDGRRELWKRVGESDVLAVCGLNKLDGSTKDFTWRGLGLIEIWIECKRNSEHVAAK